MRRSIHRPTLSLLLALSSFGCSAIVGSGYQLADGGGPMDASPRDAGPRPDAGDTGQRDAGPTPTYRRFSSLTAGERFSCAVLDGDTPAENQVLCWGLNKNAQLGRGVAELVFENDAAPVRLDLDPLQGATSVDAGRNFTCAVIGSGAEASPYCWGANNKGQVGNESASDPQVSAIVVENSEGPLLGTAQVSAGSLHACARLVGGETWCWGAGGDGQLGEDNNFDRDLAVQTLSADGTSPLTGAVQLAAGDATSCAILTGASQAPSCWGEDPFCRTNARLPVALSMRFSASVERFFTGDAFACGVLVGGTVECAGDGPLGQIGNGSMDACTGAPAQVLAPGGGAPVGGVTALSVGFTHACASDAEGVICWGGGTDGQLGDGNMVNAPTPVRVVGPGGGAPIGPAPLLAAGRTHSCAVVRAADADDQIVCWGADYGPTPVFITLP